MAKPACVIATAVWGDWHVDVYRALNVPTMLAEGNLPALTAQVDAVYTIHTTERDWNRLCADEGFRRMAALVDAFTKRRSRCLYRR